MNLVDAPRLSSMMTVHLTPSTTPRRGDRMSRFMGQEGGQTNPPSFTGQLTGAGLSSLGGSVTVTFGGFSGAVTYAGGGPWKSEGSSRSTSLFRQTRRQAPQSRCWGDRGLDGADQCHYCDSVSKVSKSTEMLCNVRDEAQNPPLGQ